MDQRLIYRKLSSVTLLLLYLLVIAPVQLWHTHGEIDTPAYATLHSEQPTIEQPENSDCLICSHHYSIHFFEGIPFPTTPESIHEVIDSEKIAFLPIVFDLPLLNKGPPAV